MPADFQRNEVSAKIVLYVRRLVEQVRFAKRST